jgi:hypothetical protein
MSCSEMCAHDLVNLKTFDASANETERNALALLMKVVAAGVVVFFCAPRAALAAPQHRHAYEPNARSSPTPRSTHASPAKAKQSAKKTARRRRSHVRQRSDVYHWSTDELMMGGVNPSKVGRREAQ